MIAERYPSEEWIHVYTDGSLRRCFFSSVVQGSLAVGKFASNFVGEVAAISEAARVILPPPGFSWTQSRQCSSYVHPPSKKG
ncbi:hypothetical protein CDAR_90911 [Caerostris darwini]|uniref:RNase H type-1 domain-containing protein n=1 Tax=Caerostris darwini TaxID=1538125 RepID=A0AAV4Q997_9ARAC|nr:hypothetical protein CDAR_90911 [Caerostris darwini]